MCELDLSKCVVKKEEYKEDPLAKAKAEAINNKKRDVDKHHRKRMLKILEHSNVDRDKVAKEAAARICKALKELNNE